MLRSGRHAKPLIGVSQAGDYALAIALVSKGQIDLKPLVTHR